MSKIEWIKVPLEEADAVVTIPAQFAELPGLDIDPAADPHEYLNYTVIGDYSYVVKGIYDLENKNRMNTSSEEELALWDEIIEANEHWELVTELPEVDVEI